MNKKELGNYGEDKAVEYLGRQGYKIIRRNFRYPRGEIDIIASNRDYIVFVEVKLRSNLRFGTPQSAVDLRKQEKIKRAADYFLLSYQSKKDIRFDVISIQIKEGKGQLKHFVNAF